MKNKIVITLLLILLSISITLAISNHNKTKLAAKLKDELGLYLSTVGSIDRAAKISTGVIGYLIEDANDNMLITDTKDNAVSEQLLMTGAWEPQITKILKRVIKKGDTVLNLGAHLGFHTINISKIVGDTGKVFAFEANPVTFKFLAINLEINHADNVTVYNKAAYSQNKSLSFLVTNTSKGNTGTAHIIRPLAEKLSNYSELVVDGVRIEDILQNVPKLNIILMDIEGGEPNAIYGAKNLIDRSDNLLIISEWVPSYSSTYADVSQYIKFWRDRGYKFAFINDKNFEEASDDMLLESTGDRDIVIAKDLNRFKTE